jgi:hypothetical protein
MDVQKAIYGANGPGPPLLPHGDDPEAVRAPRKRRRIQLQSSRASLTAAASAGANPSPAFPASQLPEGFPPELAFRALAAYSLIRTLSIKLRLSPFTPNVFLRALYLPFPNRLMGQIHVALLRFLLGQLHMGYHWGGAKGGIPAVCVVKKRKVDGLRWPLRAGDNLEYLDSYTWPVFFDDYCHLTADSLYASMHDKTDHLDVRSLHMATVEIPREQQRQENYDRRANVRQKNRPSVIYLGAVEDTGNKEGSDEEFGGDDVVPDEEDDEDYEAAPKRPKKRAKMQAAPSQHHHVPNAMISHQVPPYSRAMMGASSQQQLQLMAKQQQEAHALQNKLAELEATQQQLWGRYMQNQGSYGQHQPTLATRDLLQSPRQGVPRSQQSPGQGVPRSHHVYAHGPPGAAVSQAHGQWAPFFPANVPAMGNSQPPPAGHRQYQGSSVSRTATALSNQAFASPGAPAQSQRQGSSVSWAVPNVLNQGLARPGLRAQSQHQGSSFAGPGAPAQSQYQAFAGPGAPAPPQSEASLAPNGSTVGYSGLPTNGSSEGFGRSPPTSKHMNGTSVAIRTSSTELNPSTLPTNGTSVAGRTSSTELNPPPLPIGSSGKVGELPVSNPSVANSSIVFSSPSAVLEVSYPTNGPSGGTVSTPAGASCPPIGSSVDFRSPLADQDRPFLFRRPSLNAGSVPSSNNLSAQCSSNESSGGLWPSSKVLEVSFPPDRPSAPIAPAMKQHANVEPATGSLGATLGASLVVVSAAARCAYGPSVKRASSATPAESSLAKVSALSGALYAAPIVPAVKPHANVEPAAGVLGASRVASSVGDSTAAHHTYTPAVLQRASSALPAAPSVTDKRIAESSAGVLGATQAESSLEKASALGGALQAAPIFPAVKQHANVEPATGSRVASSVVDSTAAHHAYTPAVKRASSALPAAPPVTKKRIAESSAGIIGATPAESSLAGIIGATPAESSLAKASVLSGALHVTQNMPARPSTGPVHSPPAPSASSEIAAAKVGALAAKTVLRKGDIGGILEAFMQGREIEISSDDVSLDEAEENGAVDADNHFSSRYVHDSDPWPQFRPLRRMRSGVPYHRLLLEEKLDALEFLLDELLSSSEVANEFMLREVTTPFYNDPYNAVPYGCLPTSEELQDIENQDECAVCRKEGELLCCDGCPASYHRECIGMSKYSLPEGRWLCPECTHVDPAKFGTLHGGRKSALEWFTSFDLARAAACKSNASAEEYAIGQNHPQQDLRKESGPEALVVHGFVFSRNLTNDTGVQSYSSETEEKILPLNNDRLKRFAASLGPRGLSHWPLEQIPVNPRLLWANPLLSVGTSYFPTSDTFDPSLYQSRYRKAPPPPPMNKVGDAHLSDYESQCGSASLYALSARLSREMSSDGAIAKALRGGVDLFDPYQMIRSYALDLEKKLVKASLIDAAWGTRNTKGNIDSWSASVRKCISIPRLAKLVLKLVDAAHPRAFLEAWYHVAGAKHHDPSSAKISVDKEQPVYFQLSSDTNAKDESLRRHWERCSSGNIPTLLAKESCRLEDWIVETRPDLAAATMGRTKRKQARTSGPVVSKDVEYIGGVPKISESHLNKDTDGVSVDSNNPAESTLLQDDVQTTAFRGPSLADEITDVRDDGQAHLDISLEKRPKKAPHKRRSGRIKTIGALEAGAAPSLQTAEDGSVPGMMRRIDLQKNGKMSELEEEMSTPTIRDSLWPVAGRNLFDPMGYLPHSSARRLARNAGSIVAPFVTYVRSYEVGLASCYHVWRKRLLFCKSFEEFLMQLRVLESFVDLTVRPMRLFLCL